MAGSDRQRMASIAARIQAAALRTSKRAVMIQRLRRSIDELSNLLLVDASEPALPEGDEVRDHLHQARGRLVLARAAAIAIHDREKGHG